MSIAFTSNYTGLISCTQNFEYSQCVRCVKNQTLKTDHQGDPLCISHYSSHLPVRKTFFLPKRIQKKVSTAYTYFPIGSL